MYKCCVQSVQMAQYNFYEYILMMILGIRRMQVIPIPIFILETFEQLCGNAYCILVGEPLRLPPGCSRNLGYCFQLYGSWIWSVQDAVTRFWMWRCFNQAFSWLPFWRLTTLSYRNLTSAVTIHPKWQMLGYFTVPLENYRQPFFIWMSQSKSFGMQGARTLF